MTQFKFVGGPSRKRRRRNDPKPAPATRESTRTTRRDTTTATKEQQATQLDQPPSSEEQPQQTPLPPPYTSTDPAPTATTPCAEDNHDHDLDLFLSWPTNVNSFFDLGSAFNDPSILLNQVDFTQMLSPPSTDNSAEIQNQLLAETAHQPANILCYTDTTQQFGAPQKEPTIFTDAWKRLIARYDKEFCILPLTKDFDANPFRHNLETSKGSQLLVHCILALCYKHINRNSETNSAEVAYHKQQAVQLLRDLEGQEVSSLASAANPGSSSAASIGLTVLDAVLILMTLDCATSAHGPWLSYLHRAHSVLEATEQLGIPRTPRMRAQIGMLAWWDVTLALTTRQGCVISESMIMSQFRSDESATASTTTATAATRTEAPFYNISGCPEDLFKHMVQLGAYAREFELASTMKCVTFNMEPVLDLEKRVRDWSVPEFEDRVGFQALGVDCYKEVLVEGCEEGGDRETPDATIRMGVQPSAAEIEELAHYRQDLHHCAEAWRYGLLLYIEKVFKWRHSRNNKSTTTTTTSTSTTAITKPKAPQTLMLSFLARKILNNVSACRRTGSTSTSTSNSTSSNRSTNNVMLQKQLLLPVFLAGCETTDETLRQEAREYCIWWSEETGYDMFLTAAALLEEVWGCASTDEGSWWGGVIDGKTKGGCASGIGGIGGSNGIGGVVAVGNQYLFG